MAKLLRMPEVAANLEEAVLQEWTVHPGSEFAAQDALALVETDKAVVEVAADTAGVILKQLVPAGLAVAVGTPIAVLGDPNEEVADLTTLLAELGVTQPAPDGSGQAGPNTGQELSVPTGNVETGGPPGERMGHSLGIHPDVGPEQSELSVPAGNVEIGGPPAGRMVHSLGVHPDVGLAGPKLSVPVGTLDSGGPEAARGQVSPGQSANTRKFASPLARRLAKEAGLVLEEITGTGPGGRVRRRDIEAAIAARDASTPAAAEPTAPPEPAAVEPVAAPAGFTDYPHPRARRVIAARLTESKQTAPHFYLRATVRVDKLFKLRKKLTKHAPISVNDLLLKAAAHAHRAVPEMNVIWTPDAVRQPHSVDIALAVATDRGLVTPVVTNIDRRTIGDIAATTKDLATRAREGRIRQDELTGGTLTVTNLGMYGVEEFAAIINPPQAAILAVGKALSGREDTVIKCTLSVDHRPVDGVVAARWLTAFTEMVENPLGILC